MWFIYAVTGAIFRAITNLVRKHISQKIDPIIYIWITNLFGLIVLSPFIIVLDVEIATIATERWPQILLATGCWFLAIHSNLTAYKNGDLSYITPLTAFIPVFTLLFAWAFLGEIPPSLGILGILTIICGAYIINIDSSKLGWKEPLRQVLTNKGAQYAILTSIFFGATSVVTKSLTNGGFSPLSIIYTSIIVSFTISSLIVFAKFSEVKEIMKTYRKILISVTIVGLSGGILGAYAVSETYSSYAIGVRRLDIIFSVMLGWRVLKEQDLRNKIIGSLVMTVGVLIVTTL